LVEPDNYRQRSPASWLHTKAAISDKIDLEGFTMEMPTKQVQKKHAYLGLLAFGPQNEFYKGSTLHKLWLDLDHEAWQDRLVDVSLNRSEKQRQIARYLK
jgi:hypothetical protein